MKLVLPFVVVRKAIHVSPSPERLYDKSASLKMIPMRDEDRESVTANLWPDLPAGELNLGYLDPRMVEHIEPGMIVNVTVEVKA